MSLAMIKLLHKVRRDFKACKTCPQGPDCALLDIYNNQIKIAIEEVHNEFMEMVPAA
jgi:hypothetical protein